MRQQNLKVETPQGPVFGTLTVPDQAQAAALLIGGSGPHDRDGIQGDFDAGYAAWSPVLADQGIALLRLDKPGSGQSPLPTERPTRYAHDLIRNQAALETLKETLPDLPLFLLGHSLGALTALELDHEHVAGLALIAGAGRTLDRVLADQTRAALEQAEAPPEKITEHLAERLDLMETFKRGGIPKALPSWAGEDPEPWIHLGDVSRRDPVSLIAACQRPLCLIMGTSDDRVFDIDWKFNRAAAPQAPALLVEGMDHFLRMPNGVVNDQVLTWIGQNISKYGKMVGGERLELPTYSV